VTARDLSVCLSSHTDSSPDPSDTTRRRHLIVEKGVLLTLLGTRAFIYSSICVLEAAENDTDVHQQSYFTWRHALPGASCSLMGETLSLCNLPPRSALSVPKPFQSSGNCRVTPNRGTTSDCSHFQNGSTSLNEFGNSQRRFCGRPM